MPPADSDADYPGGRSKSVCNPRPRRSAPTRTKSARASCRSKKNMVPNSARGRNQKPIFSQLPVPKILLGLLLFLLADADLEMQYLGLLKRLVIVARHGVRKVLVNIGVFRQDRHQGEAVVAGGAEGPEPLYIRNCHISVYFSRGAGRGA